MGIGEKIINFIAPVHPDEATDTKVSERAVGGYEKVKNEQMAAISENTRIVIFEPRSYDEAEEIALHLKANRACLVNFHRVKIETAQRIIDFLYGVMVALDGSIQKIDLNVFLCSPKQMGVHGEITLDNLSN